MLRRKCSSKPFVPYIRAFSAAGQFNPIHDFTALAAYRARTGVATTGTTTTGAAANLSISHAPHSEPAPASGIYALGVEAPVTQLPTASSIEQFRKMITNPGPLRITFSPDYLDWYYKCYQSKLKYDKETAIMQEKLQQATHAADTNTASVSAAAASPLHATLQGPLNSAVVGLSHLVVRPPGSLQRTYGERCKRRAQATITRSAIEHGMLDVIERAPQFPNIHIDRCDDNHIRMIFNEWIAPQAITAQEIWERALLFRAMLIERRRSYPDSFAYIFDAVESVVFASYKGTDDKAAPAEGANRPEYARTGAKADTVGSLSDIYTNADCFPTAQTARYFHYLVKKYDIQNGVEAAVVLRCHGLPDASSILLSDPPPRDEVAAPLQCARPDPDTYPPLSALVEEEANVHLLRCLIFAEFNTIVSTDPFRKFPDAYKTVMRPPMSEISARSTAASVAGTITGRRGPSAIPLPPPVSAAIDARARDVIRLQQQHASGDAHFFMNSELARLVDANPALYAGDRGEVYNPRAIRAEIRDITSLRMLKALKKYDIAETEMVHRTSDGDREIKRDARGDHAYLVNSNGPQTFLNEFLLDRFASQITGGGAFLPSIAHYVALITRDNHISFLLSSLASLREANAVRSAVVALGEILYLYAKEYHLEDQRRLHHQKALIAASLLDDYVKVAGEAAAELVAVLNGREQAASGKEGESATTGFRAAQELATRRARENEQRFKARMEGAKGADLDRLHNNSVSADISISLTPAAAKMFLGLGPYIPFTKRSMDQHGFPTDMRYDDYERFIRPVA